MREWKLKLQAWVDLIRVSNFRCMCVCVDGWLIAAMFNNFRSTFITLNVAAPNEFTIAFRFELTLYRSIATATTEITATVKSVARRITNAICGAFRSDSALFSHIT